MLKCVITGASGQLARELIDVLKEKSVEVVAFEREKLDITNFKKVLATIREIKPDFVINCAAYNLVDKAEEEFEKAYNINCAGVLNLAIVCIETKATLVHYSTDYVFDGEKLGFYTEGDKANPLNKYGLSKYLGEEQIKNILEKFLIFRTSWVYGKGERNFLFKLKEWAKIWIY